MPADGPRRTAALPGGQVEYIHESFQGTGSAWPSPELYVLAHLHDIETRLADLDAKLDQLLPTLPRLPEPRGIGTEDDIN